MREQESTNEQIIKPSFFNQQQIVNWMQSRKQRCKNDYFHNFQSLQKIQNNKKIFTLFDSDGSGCLEEREIYKMFKLNNFILTQEETKQIFQFIDQDKNNQINPSEQKQITPEGMKKIYQKIHNRMSKVKSQNNKQDFIPYTFEKMIDYLCYKKRRQNILDLIKSKKYQNIQDFSQMITMFDQCYKVELHQVNKKLNNEDIQKERISQQAQSIYQEYKNQQLQENYLDESKIIQSQNNNINIQIEKYPKYDKVNHYKFTQSSYTRKKKPLLNPNLTQQNKTQDFSETKQINIPKLKLKNF